jgi:hypothetical protein
MRRMTRSSQPISGLGCRWHPSCVLNGLAGLWVETDPAMPSKTPAEGPTDPPGLDRCQGAATLG